MILGIADSGSSVTKRKGLLLPGVAALAAGAVVLSLPPRVMTLPVPEDFGPTVRGAVHVHTLRSDGSGTIDQVAAAAARAGLQFLVLTDHGDGTEAALGPEYRYGVLCIDGVEISSSEGHILALGLEGRAPYPLGGEARDVVEDIARLGGMSIAAHPSSRRPELRWNDWEVPVDGLEWLNADSEWRDESLLSLARALLTYPWRRAETLAALLDHPVTALAAWDRLTAGRRVVAIAGSDAHANLAPTPPAGRRGDRSLLAIPGYEAVFRAFSVHLPDLTLSGDARSDATAVVEAIRDGRLYSSIDARAAPARLELTAQSGRHTAGPGDVLPVAGPLTVHVRTTAPPDSRLRLFKGGRAVAQGTGSRLDHRGPAEPGAYRVEVELPGASGGQAPWLLSNPIYVGGFPPAAPAARPPPTHVSAMAGERGWGIEKNDESLGAHELVPLLDGRRARLRYGLGGSIGGDVYVALGMRVPTGLADFDRVTFAGRADKPMRIWVQLWMPVPTGNRYWRRSVYLDRTIRAITIPFDELTPVGEADPGGPLLADIESIMFVVDQVHTPVGTGGQIWIDNVAFGRQ